MQSCRPRVSDMTMNTYEGKSLSIIFKDQCLKIKIKKIKY